jgi:nicotinamide mononucleotide (NMN) deamidase PncC
MAMGVASLFSSQWGIGVTGYAAPDKSVPVKIPFAFYAISYKNEIVVAESIMSTKSDGKPTQEYFAQQTLKLFSTLLKDFFNKPPIFMKTPPLSLRVTNGEGDEN